MTCELNSKQIEDFAFVPVGPAPHSGGGRQLIVLTGANGQAHALIVLQRMQEIENFKARVAGPPIDSGDGAKAIETGGVLQVVTNRYQTRRVNIKDNSIGRLLGVNNSIGNLLFNGQRRLIFG